jgi:hypothetical protein
MSNLVLRVLIGFTSKNLKNLSRIRQRAQGRAAREGIQLITLR